MELAFEELNHTVFAEEDNTDKRKQGRQSKNLYRIEINPYYRFYEIFRDLYTYDDTTYKELKEVFFDLIIHQLADTDSYMGMNKREFYKESLLKDIREQFFGEKAWQQLSRFTQSQRQYLLSRILMLYEIGESLIVFKETVHNIYHNSAIYSNRREKEEILIYLGVTKDKKEEEKLSFLLEFFLPIKYEVRIYWEKHFGIVGEDKTMKLDQIVLY